MQQYREGQKLQGSDGNIYVVRNGVPTLANAPAMGPAIGNDPRLPYQVQQDRNQAAASQYAPPKAQADATIAQANAANAGVVASAEAQKAIAEAQKARVELEKLKMEQGKIDPRAPAYKALQDQIDRVTQLYQSNVQGGLWNWIAGRLGGAENEQFNAAAQGLTNPFMAAFKVEGQGGQSDADLRQFLEANVPQPTDTDAAIEEKIGNIQRRLDAVIPPKAPPNGQLDRSSPLVASEQSRPQVQASTGYRDEVDPILKGISGRLGKMVSAGASDATIVDFLRKNGVDPANTNIQSVLQHRKTDQYRAWQRANPGKSYPIGPEFYTNKVPLTPTQERVNSAAQSSVGSYLINAGNSVSGNRLDELAGALGGNPEAVKTGLQVSQTLNPNASFAGDLAGQLMFDAAFNKVPGVGRLGRAKDVVNDAVFGAFAGSGDDNTIGGVLSNVGGGLAGRGLQRAGKGLVRGVSSPATSYLDRNGVDMTIGQIMRGTGTTTGNAIGGLEDRAAGVPIFDAIINSARQRGEEGVNRAAFREIGVDDIGSAGITSGRNVVNNAYSFLDPVVMPIDAQLAGRSAAIRANLPNLPKYGEEIGRSMGLMDKSVVNGNLSGRDWQSSLRAIRGDRASLRGKEFSDQAVNALDDLESNYLDFAARQGPPGAAGDLANANQLNAKFKTLVSALDNGPAQRNGELFSASRLNDASRSGRKNFGGQVSSMEGNRPFYELTKNAMEVMPNQVPDSGTAGRALLYSGLLGGGVGAGYGAATNENPLDGGVEGALKGSTALPFALAAIYSKPGQKALQKALLAERPAAIQALDRVLSSNPFTKRLLGRKAAGMFGSASARDIVLYPELDQQFYQTP